MKKRLFRFFSNWMPVIAYCVVIYVLSASPIHAPRIRYADKVIHFCVFALLGTMVLRGLNKHTSLSAGASMVFALGFSWLFGFLDEFHQYFVPGRDADLLDLFSDVTGSFSGILSYALFVALSGKGTDGT